MELLTYLLNLDRSVAKERENTAGAPGRRERADQDGREDLRLSEYKEALLSLSRSQARTRAQQGGRYRQVLGFLEERLSIVVRATGGGRYSL